MVENSVPFHPEGGEWSGREPNLGVRQRLQNLLTSKVPFDEIVKLLNAQEYVRTDRPRRRGARPVRVFEVDRFLADAASSTRQINLPTTAEFIDDTILPPDEGEIITGSGEGLEEKRFTPRTRYLIDLLGELSIEYRIRIGPKRPLYVSSRQLR